MRMAFEMRRGIEERRFGFNRDIWATTGLGSRRLGYSVIARRFPKARRRKESTIIIQY